jgi:hypothetical protein
MSDEAKTIIRCLIRGFRFTISLLEKALRGEKVE